MLEQALTAWWEEASLRRTHLSWNLKDEKVKEARILVLLMYWKQVSGDGAEWAVREW